MIIINARNGVLNTYHLVQQLLRLPTFTIIALQLVYVLYYQVFDIMYLCGNANSELRSIYDKKSYTSPVLALSYSINLMCKQQ